MSQLNLTLDIKELLPHVESQQNVAWALLDTNGNLQSAAGEKSLFGLADIEMGQCLVDKFLCLEGVFPLSGKPYEVYELELLSNMFVNIYCFPTNVGDVVIFQDITDVTVMKKILHGKTQQLARHSKKEMTE